MSSEEQTAAGAAAAANAGADADTPADGSPEALQQALEAAQNEAAQAKDQLLRLHAEMDNLRRRTTRDVEAAHKFGQEKLMGALVTVVDNLERASTSATAAAASPEAAAIAEGVDLSLQQFIDTLARFGVETLDPVGQPFDPKFHQAMSMVENPDMEPNSVMQVLQKGYSLNGRLLRPAMVVVSRVAAPRIDERA